MLSANGPAGVWSMKGRKKQTLGPQPLTPRLELMKGYWKKSVK